jgi:hypothetical protein
MVRHAGEMGKFRFDGARREVGVLEDENDRPHFSRRQ